MCILISSAVKHILTPSGLVYTDFGRFTFSYISFNSLKLCQIQSLTQTAFRLTSEISEDKDLAILVKTWFVSKCCAQTQKAWCNFQQTIEDNPTAQKLLIG